MRVFILVVVGGAILILALKQREPRYHGRALTSWLQICYDPMLNDTQQLAEAQDAVRAMPINRVLPRLLKLVECRDDPVSPWIIQNSEDLRIRFLKWRSAEDFQQLGIAGFEALGTNAAPAVGELAGLLHDDQHAFTAIRCLIFIGKPAEQPVWQALTNSNPQVKYVAVSQLSWVTDDVEEFIARMKDCLNDPDVSIRLSALRGIGDQTDAPDSAIPILLNALTNENERVSTLAAKCLEGFGTNAVKTLPVLSNIVVNGIPAGTARQALLAMVAIAPEESLPLILKNLQSPDPHLRSAALAILCKYPFQTPAVQSAIQQAAGDADPRVARFAKKYLTEKYIQQHPVDSEFTDDPSYGGKSLGEWLKMRDHEGKFSEEAKNALRQMGTNMIPALLKRLTYQQPPFNLPGGMLKVDAARGFIALGEQAKPAIPQLEALMDSQDKNTAALSMIAASGTGADAIPCLVKGLTNQFANVRLEAAHYLGGDFSARFPQQCKAAIPFLVSLLNDTNTYVSLHATNALKRIDPQTAAKLGIK